MKFLAVVTPPEAIYHVLTHTLMQSTPNNSVTYHNEKNHIRLFKAF